MKARIHNNREMAGQGGRDGQPKLPFSNAPIDWTLPVEFHFNQLRDVSAAADKAGFRIVRLKVVPGGYEAQFQRDTIAKPSDLKPI